MANSLSKPPVLVAIPRFAQLDELLSALALAKVLARSGVAVQIYFGEFNYPSRLQQLFPADELQVYQPLQSSSKLELSLKLPKTTVSNLNWEQTAAMLSINLEVSGDLKRVPDIQTTGNAALGKIILIGATTLKSLENYQLLAKQPSFSRAAIQALTRPSNSEAVANYLRKLKLQPNAAEQLLLEQAKYYANLVPGQQLSPRITSAEVSSIYQFWGNFASAEPTTVADLADFFALLRLGTKLQPHFLLQQGSYSWQAISGPAALYITTDLQFRLNSAHTSFSYRILPQLLIGLAISNQRLVSSETQQPKNHIPLQPALQES